MKPACLLGAAALLMMGGCSFGAGSAFVGQWRPHDRVDVDACLMDEGGRCAERKQVTTHVPERAFWGVLIAYPAASSNEFSTVTSALEQAARCAIHGGTGR